MNKKRGYISTKYSINSHPYTSYPDQLCKYLFDRFNMKENMTLLEPGCGRCEFLKGFKKLKMNVRGTDISEESKDFVKDIEIQLCDMDKENLPYKDHTFDVVFSKSFIEHLHDPKKYISESMRVLKKGGLLITLTPDWESNYKKFYDDFTHRSPFTTISLKDVYELNNFKDVNTFKFRQLPIVWKYPLLNYFCSFISIFIPVRVTNKFLRWSRELMLIGVGRK
tara:strand:- start:78 stop:746 length:669 start_codon:yes stop_codon:yes gene_type:complete